jgi:hypothetical protein
MKLRVFFAFFLMICGVAMQGAGLFQGFDKGAFYSVMASGSIGDIDAELSTLYAASVKEKEAYEGALLMKKAGLLAKPKEKLAIFKSGYRKLESSLAMDSSNGEYHFLRLTIQEHAPRVVKYYKDQDNDRQHVCRSFKTLSPVVQKAILDYSKHSKILITKELNG